jgi:hypothetical protein
MVLSSQHSGWQVADVLSGFVRLNVLEAGKTGCNEPFFPNIQNGPKEQ